MIKLRTAFVATALLALCGCDLTDQGSDTTRFMDTNGSDPNPEMSEPFPAKWQIDPEFTPMPESTSLQLIVQEIQCSSGIDPTGRIEAVVQYSETEIAISIIVHTVGGDVTCPGNPQVRFLLQLTEPLGDRTIVGEDPPQ